jgi:hypothetical protein
MVRETDRHGTSTTGLLAELHPWLKVPKAVCHKAGKLPCFFSTAILSFRPPVALEMRLSLGWNAWNYRFLVPRDSQS